MASGKPHRRYNVHYECNDTKITAQFEWNAPTDEGQTIDGVLKEFVAQVHKEHPKLPLDADALQIEDTSNRILAGENRVGVCVRHGDDLFARPKPEWQRASASLGTTEETIKAKAGKKPATPPRKVSPKLPPSDGQNHVSENPDVQAVVELLTVAKRQVERRQYATGAQLLEQICEAIPNLHQAEALLGKTYALMHKYELAAKRFERAIEIYPASLEYFIEWGNALYKTGDFSGSREVLNRAIDTIGKDGVTVDESTLNELKALLGRALYSTGEQEAAIALFQNVIQSDERHKRAILEYGRAAKDRHKLPEAFRLALAAMVAYPDDREVRAFIASLIKEPKAMEALYGELHVGASGSAPALAFLAVVVKDFGAIEQSLELYSKSVELAPQNPSYALNYAHTLEVRSSPQAAVDAIRKYLLRNSNMSVSNVTNAQVLKEIENLSNIHDPKYLFGAESQSLGALGFELHLEGDGKHLAWRFDKTKKRDARLERWEKIKSVPKDGTYTPEELDVLAIWFTLAKVLFVSGCLARLPGLLLLIDPLREGKNLHLTTIRNEQAYWMDIVLLMQHLPFTPSPPAYKGTVFLCGDSHSLSPSWHTIQFQGKPVLLRNALVTGLKVWHLRPESNFYPKRNFEYVIDTIPNGSNVIMLFGEIDCREGLLLAVERGYYPDLESGMRATVRVYIDALRKIQNEHNFKLHIHPANAVLDVTRHIVRPFNGILREEVLKCGIPNVYYLDVFEQTLTEDGSALRKEYEFDGTHMHPDYVKVLQTALVAEGEQLSG